jgi:hypothetical protein
MGRVERPSDTALTFSVESLIKDAEDKPLPPVQVIFYKEADGSVPMVEWIEGLQKKPRQKCFEWIERLMTFEYDLHRPYADTLGDGIHELRVRFQSVNYRMLFLLS